jgi:hypothetical protein
MKKRTKLRLVALDATNYHTDRDIKRLAEDLTCPSDSNYGKFEALLYDDTKESREAAEKLQNYYRSENHIVILIEIPGLADKNSTPKAALQKVVECINEMGFLNLHFGLALSSGQLPMLAAKVNDEQNGAKGEVIVLDTKQSWLEFIVLEENDKPWHDRS